MSKTILRLVSAILIAIFLCVTDFSLQPSKVEAQVFKDPLLEYSYHVKIDLVWLRQFLAKICDTTGLNKRQASKIQEILDIVETTGLLDMENMTLDFQLDKDRFTGSTKISVKPDAIGANLLCDAISIPPRASVVRAMIPEDRTLAWISIMDPLPYLDMLDEYFFQPEQTKSAQAIKSKLAITNPFKEGLFAELLTKCHGFIGNEAHLVLFNLGGFDDINPRPYGALIIQMKEGINDDDIKIIRETFKSMFVDKFGGKMEIGSWEGRFEVLSFKDFGCPLDITPSLIVDKNYLILATHPETLYEAAGYVLTPTRTAQGMPVLMNAMISINMDKLMKILPSDALGFMVGMDLQDRRSALSNAIKEEEWGSIQLMRTHLPDGVMLDCSMDRSLFSLLFTLWQEVVSSGIRQPLLSASDLEAQVKSNLHAIQVAIERYSVDKKGKFPENSKELIELGYMSKFPINPFTNEPMKDIAFKDRAAGEFMYIPMKNSETGLIDNFYLLGYGETENKYDKLNNEALTKNGLVEDNSDGISDDVLLIITGGGGLDN